MKQLFLFIFIIIVFCIPLVKADIGYNLYSPEESYKFKDTCFEEKILFIVDFSNSMNDELNGVRKIDTAIYVLQSIISRLNPKIAVGLRVYGHKNGFNQLLGCTASDLITPILPNNHNNIFNALSRVRATGWTPITYSLKKAVTQDFVGTKGQKRIILLTDGGENCDESPCEYAINLISERNDIRIDVIAFAINDADADKQLKCTALATYGNFFKANDAESLMNSFEKSLNITKDVQGTIIKKK